MAFIHDIICPKKKANTSRYIEDENHQYLGKKKLGIIIDFDVRREIRSNKHTLKKRLVLELN